MSSGLVVIGYEGSPASEGALRDAAELLSVNRALVVSVWEAGGTYEGLEVAPDTGMPIAPIDHRTMRDVDSALYERARRTAAGGARLAAALGLDAESLAVADDVTVAETLVRIAQERDAQAIVVGSHRRPRFEEALLGSTSRGVIRRATCPVLIGAIAERPE